MKGWVVTGHALLIPFNLSELPLPLFHWAVNQTTARLPLGSFHTQLCLSV